MILTKKILKENLQEVIELTAPVSIEDENISCKGLLSDILLFMALSKILSNRKFVQERNILKESSIDTISDFINLSYKYHSERGDDTVRIQSIFKGNIFTFVEVDDLHRELLNNIPIEELKVLLSRKYVRNLITDTNYYFVDELDEMDKYSAMMTMFRCWGRADASIESIFSINDLTPNDFEKIKESAKFLSMNPLPEGYLGYVDYFKKNAREIDLARHLNNFIQHVPIDEIIEKPQAIKEKIKGEEL